MKKIVLFITLFSIAISTAGCTEAKTDTLQTMSALEQSSEVKQTEIKNETGYFGTWKVIKCAATSAAYALSEEEIQEMIGKKVVYTPDSCGFEGYPNKLNGYEEELKSTDSLWNDYRVKAEDLGLREDNFLNVSILAEGNIFGNYFFVKDTNTLLIYYEGVFFEAVKEE